jgi:uncharacterized membrane protein YvbJ
VEQNFLYCPFCAKPLQEGDYFCPNCGKKIREQPLFRSYWKQLSIYAVSIFLPPLGLWPGLKYLRQNDPKLKTIGVIAILLTLISLVVSTLLFVNLMKQVNDQVNQQLQDFTF